MLQAFESEVYSRRNSTATPAAMADRSLGGPATTQIELRVGQFRYRVEIRLRDRVKWTRIAERLQELSEAEENWDSYGACRMQADALFPTISLLVPVVAAGRRLPFMTLTSDGGIHLDWTANGRAVEVEIRSESDQCALFIDENLGSEEERAEFTGLDIAEFLIA